MSDLHDDRDQRKVESTSRMWVESQPGPSRCQPSRQGYCGYCRVIYSNLDQHLSSLRHLDSVRTSSRVSSTVATTSSSRTTLTLLERFLQDVLQHHPHRYNDPRPSHDDLPSVSTPLLPRAELDDLRFPDDDSCSLGTRENLSNSDHASYQLANQKEDDRTHSQSGEGVTGLASWERLSDPIRDQEEGGAIGHTLSLVQTPPPHHQAPPSVHRKAHRKTNRRKASDSSTSSLLHRGPDPGPRPPDPSPQPQMGPDPGPWPPDPGPWPPTQPRPWLSWQKERREALKDQAFSSDHSDALDQTIEEVIQMCHGVSSTPRQLEETESFHFSLPVSLETQSDDWDAPVQRGTTLRDTPVQVSQVEGRDISCLMDVQVDLEDQVYSYQLESALQSDQRTGGGVRQDEGFWTLPIEEVLPAPKHFPESFRGKTWTQIEQEDEEKVVKLVQQFRRERFVCYFDSESLARYGRRSQNKGHSQNKEAEPANGILPLLDCDDDSPYVRRTRRGGRTFRVASRCQVVKVSHSTQTVQWVAPAVRQQAWEAPPTSGPAANRNSAERTPEAQTWRSLPPSYSNIVTPLQPCTSLVYLLCSPSGPTYTPAPGSALKRCRKKRRPLDPQGLKVTYKQHPVRFYDASSNRILKNPPKRFLWRQGPPNPPPPCIRQLFRSLSPDLNADRPPGEGTAGSSRVRGQRSSDSHRTTFSHANSFLLSTLSRDSSQAPPPSHHSRSEQGRGGGRTQPPPSKRRTKAETTPPQPRREGLRRAGPGNQVPGSTGPLHRPSPRRGRARRRGGCERR